MAISVGRRSAALAGAWAAAAALSAELALALPPAPEGDSAKHHLVRRQALDEAALLRPEPSPLVAWDLSYLARLDPARAEAREAVVDESALQIQRRERGEASAGSRLALEPPAAPAALVQALAASSRAGAAAAVPRPLPLAGDRHTVVTAVLSVLLGSLLAGLFQWARSLEDVRAAGEGTSSRRLPVLDNAKFWMLTVVIAVHWECCFAGSRLPWHETILRPLNPWCTRCLAFLSGSVSQAPVSGKAFVALTFRILAPYIIFNAILGPLVLFPLTEWQLPDFRSIPYLAIVSCFYAENVSWYLIALVQWKLWSCFLSPMRPSAQVFMSLALAACGGYAGISALRFDWAVATFPLFVAGQCFPVAKVVARMPTSASTAAVGLAMLSSVFYLQSCDMTKDFMDAVPTFGWSSEEHFGLTGEWMEHSAYPFFWVRGLFRNLLELTKTLAFVLLCCPRSDGLLASLGQHTMYPYLLHYSMLGLCERVWAKVVLPSGGGGVAVVALLAAFGWLLALNALLTSPPVRWLFGPFIEPTWLRRLCGADAAEAPVKAPRPWPGACSRRPSARAPGAGR